MACIDSSDALSPTVRQSATSCCNRSCTWFCSRRASAASFEMAIRPSTTEFTCAVSSSFIDAIWSCHSPMSPRMRSSSADTSSSSSDASLSSSVSLSSSQAACASSFSSIWFRPLVSASVTIVSASDIVTSLRALAPQATASRCFRSAAMSITDSFVSAGRASNPLQAADSSCRRLPGSGAFDEMARARHCARTCRPKRHIAVAIGRFRAPNSCIGGIPYARRTNTETLGSGAPNPTVQRCDLFWVSQRAGAPAC